MVIKRKDFQKAAAFIHEFLLKLNEDVECAEVRDTLNLALLHMQKYYRLIQNRSQDKNGHALSLTTRGLSPMTPFVDAPDKFIWRWVNLDNTRNITNMSLVDRLSFVVLPPLISAAKNGDVELISEIIQQDPSCTDCTDGLGRTAVMYAVHYFQHGALEFLLEHRADVNAQAHDESTAIHRACHDANHNALKLLVKYGGDFTVYDVQGRAPIHWAVTTRSTECLQILLAHGASVGTRDKDMLTPSMWACRMDNIKHFELLCHAETNRVEEHDGIERDANGRTWMHWSVRRSQPLECLQTLLTPDSAAIKDKEGKTVLLVAAEMGSLHACRVILDIAGEKCIQYQDNQGRTALHVATMGGHGDVVNFLLEKNADVNVVDNYNATAWDYARIRKLHYCQLIIMSHQRQRMSNNPMSPIPHGLGLLMQTESGEHDLSKMNFRNRSSQSTPITPPHPPKRPRSSRILVRRANSLTTADRERISHKEQERMNSSEERASVGGQKDRILVSMNMSNKRLSDGEVFFNGREDTIMTDSSRPVFEDENDEISVGGMDVSDEDEAPLLPAQPSGGPSQQTSRPRPPPRRRPEYLRASSPQIFMQDRGDHSEKSNMNNNNNNLRQHPQKLQQHQLTHRMEFEDATLGSSTSALDQNGKPGSQHVRPQARVPPTPLYRPSRGAPIPTPPSATPQRPHMIRQQQPLPPSTSHRALSPQQQSRELLSPPSRDASPSLSSQNSEPQQHNSRSDKPGSGDHQPPGVLEGFRIPPPALSPLQNAPKPPDLDMFDRKDKKKKKEKKGKKLSQKPENPSDIAPPFGFAAPLHPHLRGQSGHGIHINPAAIPAPKYAKGAPQMSESRYVDENFEDDGKPPVVNGFAVQIREGISKSAKPRFRSGIGAVEETEKMDSSTTIGDAQEEGIVQSSVATVDEEDQDPYIPPPPSFRGVTRSGAGRSLAQSIPQDNKSSRMLLTSAKPPLPKNRNNAQSSGPQSPPKRVASGFKSRSPIS